MRPADFQTDLERYADGELERERSSAIEDALQREPALRAEVERWQRLRQAARRGVCAVDAPDGLRARVLADLKAARRSRMTWWHAALGLAAVVALLLVFRGVWGSDAPRDPALEGRLVTADHFTRFYVLCAVGSHSDYESPLPETGEFERKLCAEKPYRVAVPSLRAHGYELEGVCNCFDMPGVDLVHAHYRAVANPDDVLSVFSVGEPIQLKGCSRHRGCGGERVYELVQAQDVTLLKWSASDASYVLCGKAGRERLESMADELSIARRPIGLPDIVTISILPVP